MSSVRTGGDDFSGNQGSLRSMEVAQPLNIPTYARLPLCIDPGTHYFQLDLIKRDTAVCTRCGLIRKEVC